MVATKEKLIEFVFRVFAVLGFVAGFIALGGVIALRCKL